MDQVKAELDRLAADLKAAQDEVLKQLKDSFVDSIPGVDFVITQLQNLLSGLQADLATATNDITTQIASATQGLIPDAVTAIEGYIGNLVADVESVISNLSTAEDFGATIIGILKHHAPDFSTWLYDRIVQGFGNTAIGVMETLERDQPQVVDQMLDELAKVHNLPLWFHTQLATIRGRHAPLVAFVLPALILAALLPSLGAMGEPIVESVRQGAWSNLRTKELDPGAIVELWQRKELLDHDALTRLSHYGFNDDVANYMLRAQEARLDPRTAAAALFQGHYTPAQYEREVLDNRYDTERAKILRLTAQKLPAEDLIRDAFLRGFISGEDHSKRLEALGYTSDFVPTMTSLYYRLPSVLDLSTMASRNVFDSTEVARLGLNEELPPQVAQTMGHLGVAAEWIPRYWQSHWTSPGIAEGLTMFHRTTDKSTDEHPNEITLSDGTKVETVIGKASLASLFREHGLAPFYRDKMEQVTYAPLTRFDIRGMEKVGILNHAGVQRAFLDRGYSPERAAQLADYIVRVNAAETKDRGLPMLDEIRKRIIALYVADKIDINEASFAFADLGFTNAEADYYLAAASMIQAADDAAAEEAGIGRLFTGGFIQEEDARELLATAGVPDAGVERLVMRWNLEIEYSTDKRMTAATKQLTKTEILQAFEAGMILEEDAVTYLGQIGEPPAEAEVLIHLAKYRRDKTARTAQIEALKALYVSGVMDPATVSTQLDALGVLSGQRDAFLAEWELLRQQRIEKLPIATIRDMLKADVLTQDETEAQLRRHRFTDEDIARLIQLWQSPRITGGRGNAAIPGSPAPA